MAVGVLPDDEWSEESPDIGRTRAEARLALLRERHSKPPGPLSMERAHGRRAWGTGGISRNGPGYFWQLQRDGRKYRGPTVPSREEALTALSAALVALDNREEPIQAPPSKSGRPRSRTIAPAALLRQVKKVENEEWIEATYPEDVERPQTRGDCAEMPRPCPFVSCSQNLFLDVNPDTGAIKFNFPHLNPWEMKESCALDLADKGGITLEEVGAAMGLTRERIRQYEVRALDAIKRSDKDGELGLPPDRP